MPISTSLPTGHDYGDDIIVHEVDLNIKDISGDVILNGGPTNRLGDDYIIAHHSYGVNSFYGDTITNIGSITHAGSDIITLSEANSASNQFIYGDLRTNLATINNAGDDILVGSDGRDIIYGDVRINEGDIVNTGVDIIFGGKGDDYLVGDVGGGDGTITKASQDYFVYDFAIDNGNDVIYDFDMNDDSFLYSHPMDADVYVDDYLVFLNVTDVNNSGSVDYQDVDALTDITRTDAGVFKRNLTVLELGPDGSAGTIKFLTGSGDRVVMLSEIVDSSHVIISEDSTIDLVGGFPTIDFSIV